MACVAYQIVVRIEQIIRMEPYDSNVTTIGRPHLPLPRFRAPRSADGSSLVASPDDAISQAATKHGNFELAEVTELQRLQSQALSTAQEALRERLSALVSLLFVIGLA